ncbi:MAG: RNA polymerase sigma factor, partial [Nitrospira sp.]|nr:RNA polymerase sigma factor [Nitrospira sp.]
MTLEKKSRRRNDDGPAPSIPVSGSFDQLYRDHVDIMYRFAYRLCGEAETAKDLVQETFLNAYRAYGRFRGDAQVSTWLYAIASHACLRMRRKRKGEPDRELSLEE